MIPCLFDEKQHQIILGGEIIGWCKRNAPAKERKRFFLYRHRIHRTFVIARWALDRASGIFTDFLHIGHSLDEFTRQKADEFRRRLYAPTQAPEIARAIDQASKNFDKTQQNEIEERQEEIKERQKV